MRLDSPGGCRSRLTVGLPRLPERRNRWIIGARRLRQERRLARQSFDDARQRFPALQGLTQALDELLRVRCALGSVQDTCKKLSLCLLRMER